MCSITIVMGRERTVYHRLVDLLASKHGWTYSTTLSLVHCVLVFFFVAVCHYVYVYGGRRSISFGSSSASAEIGLAMSSPDV